MKKLNLLKMSLSSEDVISKNHMSSIYGGSGSSGSNTHTWYCTCSAYGSGVHTFEATDQEAPGFALNLSYSCSTNDLHCAKRY
tara:strand:- start:6671 stop:6919 length:249 start_codon:yes stop_codon:yes gene_type:complete